MGCPRWAEAFHPGGRMRKKVGLGKGQAHREVLLKGRWDGSTPKAIQLLHSKAGLGRGFQGQSRPWMRQGCGQFWKPKVLNGALKPWGLSCRRCSCFCVKWLMWLGIADTRTIKLFYYSEADKWSDAYQGRGNFYLPKFARGFLPITKESHSFKMAALTLPVPKPKHSSHRSPNGVKNNQHKQTNK